MAGIAPIAAIGQAVTGGIAALGAPAASAAGLPGAATPATVAGSGTSFLDNLGSALQSLNGQLTTADASMADFASGGSADLHTVMLDLQEASLGLKVGIAVRDKLLEAYQEVMRLSI